MKNNPWFSCIEEKLEMSFLSEIKEFSKSSLKKADTEITTVGGRRVRETRDEHGHVTSEVCVTTFSNLNRIEFGVNEKNTCVAKCGYSWFKCYLLTDKTDHLSISWINNFNSFVSTLGIIRRRTGFCWRLQARFAGSRSILQTILR